MSPSSTIAESAIIAEFVTIKENCIVGENTIIGPFNILESGVRIGKNVTIQPHCVITRDMQVGDNVFIGPHFSCSNDAVIPNKEHGTSPNKKPFITSPPIVQDGVRMGTRVTLAPGVTVHKDAFVKMCTFVKSDVPEGKVIPSGVIYDERDL